MSQAMDLRLVAYDADGDRLGTLPQPLSLDLGLPLNDLPSLTVKYTEHAARGELASRALHAGTIIAVEASAGGGWNEIAGARFIVQRYSTDTIDEQRVYDLTCTSWVAELRYGIIERNQSGDSRNFINTNPGAIMARLLNDVADSGGLPHLVYNFGHVADSAGQEWGQGERLQQVEYQIGDDLLSVLQNLVELGIVDWTTRGDELLLYRPNTVLANRWDDGADFRDLVIGRDITEAPETATFEDVASRIVVRGKDGLEVTETNPSAPTPFGHRTIYHSAGGVADEGTLRKIGQLELAQRAVTKMELTRGISLAKARWLPILNYEPGDYIVAPGAGQEMQALRVRQVTLTRDETGMVSGNVTLNDRFVEKELRNALKLAAVLRGVSGSGTDSDPGEDRPERQVPAIVGQPLISTETYLDTMGEPRGQVNLSWSPVTQDTQGRTIEIESYQLGQRHIAPHNLGGWHAMQHVDESPASMSPFEIDSVWQFRVRARSTSGVYGAWSVPAEITIARDTEPPPQPQFREQDISSRLGTVALDITGLTFQGTMMPPDTSYIAAHISLSTGFTPTPATEYDSVPPNVAGVIVIPGLDYNDTIYVKLVAVDTSGNWSEPSDEQSATVEPLVDEDLIETTIDDRFEHANDRIDTIQGEVDNIPDDVVDTTQLNNAVSTAFDNAQTQIDDIINNVIPGLVDEIEMDEGRITGSTSPPTPADAQGKPENALWLQYDGQELIGTWILVEGQWLERAIETVHIDTGTYGDLSGLRIAANTITTNQLAVGSADGTIIADGAIVTRHITTDAIQARHVAAEAIEADHLAANSIQSPHIGAGVIEGRHVAANTISTRALAVGGSENLIVNPRFADTEQNDAMLSRSDAGWEFRSGTFGVGYEHSYARFATGANALLRLHDWADGQIPVTPGETYLFETQASFTGTPGPGNELLFWLRAGSADGSFASHNLGQIVPSSNGDVLAVEWVCPDEVVSVAPSLYARTSVTGQVITAHRVAFRHMKPGVLIEDGAIVAEHITSNSIDTRHLRALSVETGHLKANAITADKADIGDLRGEIISGRVIRGEHLQIGTIGPRDLSGVGVNHVTDPSFEDSAYWNGINGALVQFGNSGADWSSATATSDSGTRSLRCQFSGGTAAWQYITPEISAPESNRVYVAITGRRGGGASAPASDVQFTLSVRCIRNNGQVEYQTSSWRNFPDGTAWSALEEVVGLPGYTAAYQVRVFVRRAGGGDLANSQVFFDSAMVQDATMSKGINRVQIDPQGVRILSGSSHRVSLTAGGLKGRAPSGNLTLDLQTTTGNVQIAGSMRTGFTKPYIHIAHHQGRPAIQLHSVGSTSSWPARLAAGGSEDQDAIALYSARRTGDQNNMSLTMFPGVRGFRLGARAAGRPYFSGGNPSGDESIFVGIYGGGPYGSLTRRPGFTGNGADGEWAIGNSQQYLAAQSQAHLRLINNDGTTWISGQPLMLMGGQVRFSTISSVGSATRLGINSNNQIVAVSSTQRIKTDIEPLDVDPGLALRLRERQFTDTSEAGFGGRGAGLVAEEVEEAGLPEELLIRDEHGRVEGIHYEQAWVTLLPLLRDLHARLTALEGGS